jgi:hypothetical protein
MGMSAGSHSRVQNWVSDKNAGIKITASRFDAENDDFSSSLGVMIARDGQSTIIGNIPFSNFKITGTTAASALTDLTTYEDVQKGRPNFVTVVETTAQNSISATPAVAITAYTTGQPVYWIPGFNNTGATTLNISGLSAASVQVAGAALTSGMLLSGVPVMAIQDGSGWHVMNPQRSPADFLNTAGIQDNSVTLAKINHESTQGAIFHLTASGTPGYITATTSGLPLVTKGASVDAAFQALGPTGLASDSVIEAKILDDSVSVAKLKAEGTHGGMVVRGAAGDPSELTVGTLGFFLQANGASSNLAWSQTLAAELIGADNTVSGVNFKDVGVITSALGNTAGGTVTCNMNNGNSFTATVTGGASTIAFSNFTGADEYQACALTLTNGGSQTITWTAVDWEGGTAPTLTAAGVDLLGFYSIDAGTTVHGVVVSTDSK